MAFTLGGIPNTAAYRGENLPEKVRNSIVAFGRCKERRGSVTDNLHVYQTCAFPGSWQIAVDLASPDALSSILRTCHPRPRAAVAGLQSVTLDLDLMRAGFDTLLYSTKLGVRMAEQTCFTSRSATVWRKSTRSSSSSSSCVEIAVSADAVLVRDSKNQPGGLLRFAAQDWRTFLAGMSAR